MNKFLVTGGAGFIDSHTVDQLFELELRVMVLDTFHQVIVDNCLNLILYYRL